MVGANGQAPEHVRVAQDSDMEAASAEVAGERHTMGDDGSEVELGFSGTLYGLFFLLGTGSLFPWNAIISETAYFSTRFCGTSHDVDFESEFSVAYNLSNLIALIVLLRVQRLCSESALVLWPLGLTMVVFAALAAGTGIDHVPAEEFYRATMAMVVLCGIASAPFIAGICAVGAQFPSVYLSGIFSGQAFAGVCVSITALATTWAAPRGAQPPSNAGLEVNDARKIDMVDNRTHQCDPFSVDWGAFAYFLVAVVVTVACVVAYAMLKKHPVALLSQRAFAAEAQHTTTGATSTITAATDTLREPLLHSTTRNDDGGGGGGGGGGDQPDTDVVRSEDEVGGGDHLLLVTDTAACAGANVHAALPAVAWQISWFAWCVWFNFTVSLALFPAVVSAIKPVLDATDQTRHVMLRELWTPALFLLFNATDFCGRLLAGRYIWVSARSLPRLCVARVLFIPLLLATNINVAAENSNSIARALLSDASREDLIHLGDDRETAAAAVTFKWLAHANAWPVVLVAMLGLSNGYCQSLAMMFGPRAVHASRSDVASTLMVFALTLGLTCGSLLSFLLMDIVAATT